MEQTKDAIGLNANGLDDIQKMLLESAKQKVESNVNKIKKTLQYKDHSIVFSDEYITCSPSFPSILTVR